MKFFATALGSSLALTLAVPAAAQAPAAPAAAQPTPRQLKLSAKAQKAIVDLDTAVKAKNTAAIPGLIAAAQAVASTNDDRYAIATRQLQAAIDSNDYAGLVVAADAMRASGAPATETTKIYQFATQRFAAAKQYPQASAALDKWIAGEPNNADALLLKADLLHQQGRAADAVAALNQAIVHAKSSGAAVPESWYQAQVGWAYDGKLPTTYEVSRQWVTAYPSPVHWRDTINIYRNMSGLDRPALIDLLRLARVTKSLAGESDYVAWSQSLINRGYPGEALAILQEGIAGGTISASSGNVAPLLSAARSKSVGAEAQLIATGKTASGAATSKPATIAADGLLGLGKYSDSAALYRTALTKPGVDKDVANLRLGEALLQSGDKPGAMAAFQAVGGTQVEIAKYWMAYASTRA